MLSENDFQSWCDRNEISEEAKQEIQVIRSSEPSRKVGGGKRSVSGRYSSQKMGVTIQFESHKVELPFIYQLEHDEDVLEYYDQPPPFKLSYQSESGKNIGFFYTPDFFVIRTHSAGWWECKTEENLQKLAKKNSNRYFLDDENHWRCSSAEDYANQFGLDFSIWSSASVNWTIQRNLEFLEDYYRVKDRKTLNESSFIAITSIIKAKPGITLFELFHVSEEIETDEIYHLIAQETIYLDLSVAPLVEPEKCFLFCDHVTALSYSAIAASQATNNTVISPIIDLNVGNIVIYNGKALTIALIGEDNILLQTADNQPIEFPQDTFENLIRQGKITSFQKVKTNEIDLQALELLQKASEKDLKDANYRYRSIQPYLNGQPIRRDAPQKRSLRNWLSAYKKSEQQYGYGYLGLLNFEYKKGNRNRRLPQNILDKVKDFIENHYQTKKQPTKQSSYAAFADFCSKEGISNCQIPSYKTFIKEIKNRSGYEQTLKRAGSRAAYELEQFYWELNLTTPRHGDFPFHICHIDHTQSDIELRCSKTGKSLGRPWITFLVDAFSRSILAVYITYDPPSYRSCMMVLRICVQRHGRLPQTIVTDNGKEFHSTYFETLLAMFECTLKHRPAAKARFSGVCERLFGTTNQQLLYNLAGNTQITKKVRFVTKSVNPKNLSLWNISFLYLYLCEWAYEVYETTEHPALDGYSPREAFINGAKQFGIYRTDEGKLAIKSRILETDLGWALEQALKHRHPQIFFIDEAHHMLAVASGRKLTEVPEAIKSLANRTEVLHGLIGTYDLLTLHDIGDQLSRRSLYIHLPCYDAKFIEDREDWQSIVWNFQTQIPIEAEPDFVSDWEYLYERSLGCVGILKNWTRNAFADAMEDEAKTVTLQHLERRALSIGQCRNILKKIKEGEKRYTEIEGEVEKLRTELELGIEPISRTQQISQSYSGANQTASQKPKSKKTVGQRKAKRDSVGIEQNAG